MKHDHRGYQDHVICCQPPPPYGCGGFQKECKEKYDDLTFSMIVEVFRYMPIIHTSEPRCPPSALSLLPSLGCMAVCPTSHFPPLGPAA